MVWILLFHDSISHKGCQSCPSPQKRPRPSRGRFPSKSAGKPRLPSSRAPPVGQRSLISPLVVSHPPRNDAADGAPPCWARQNNPATYKIIPYTTLAEIPYARTGPASSSPAPYPSPRPLGWARSFRRSSSPIRRVTTRRMGPRRAGPVRTNLQHIKYSRTQRWPKSHTPEPAPPR